MVVDQLAKSTEFLLLKDVSELISEPTGLHCKSMSNKGVTEMLFGFDHALFCLLLCLCLVILLSSFSSVVCKS